MSQRDYFFYLWQNQYTGMTCYGITNNLQRRKSEYQGHCGFDMDFSFALSAKESIVKELEAELKGFIHKLELGYRDYEWINSDVEYSTIEDTVISLVGDKPATILTCKR